nr:immunoglobulin light chain junction region [Macaca mulatta]MOV37086.1 immunoglobulin light chain junction region [Macaca mulatta]MOV37514.1 immunoglobulin light chain junction region [Macaca mulatta]
CQKYSSTPYSF